MPPAWTKPADRLPFQYSLRTIFVVMLVTGAVSGVLRACWGHWPAALLVAWVALALSVPLLMASPWTLTAGLISVLAGLVWAVVGRVGPPVDLRAAHHAAGNCAAEGVHPLGRSSPAASGAGPG